MTSTTPDKENERQDAVVSTALPSTLPLSCFHPHLHHTQQQTLRVKVLFTEGVLYRAFFDHYQQPFVEAVPNQMTLLRSHDPDGRFFRCWSVDDDGSGYVQESMYCVDHTPLASGLHPFNVARVIGQASRLLDRVRKIGASNVKLCWKAPSPLPSPPSSPIHYTVPGLGRFTVRANGHVRCVFIDRTIVDFYNTSKTDMNRENDTPDLTSRGSGLNSSCPPGFDRGRGVEVARGVWVDQNWCRLLQPNGRYLILSTHHPTSHHKSVEMWFFGADNYSTHRLCYPCLKNRVVCFAFASHCLNGVCFRRYIEMVRDWCVWLARPDDRRGQFYQRTIYDQHTQREVLAELSKIGRFTAIMTHQLPPSNQQEIGGCGQINEECGQPEFPPFVKDALRQTKNIVQDIDTILGK
jgi:hypothetical protein